MRARIVAVLCAGGMLAGFGAVICAAAPSAHKAPAAEDALSPEDAMRLSTLMTQIEDTNQQIDARFEDIIAELKIVKVRASMKRDQED